MRLSSIFTPLLLFLFSLPLFSQIENEIRDYKDSTLITINKGRELLGNSLASDQTGKTKEIYTYLTEFTKDRGYSAFYVYEDLYLNLLIQDWEKLDSLFKNIKEITFKRIHPESYPLINLLYSKVIQKKESLELQISNQDLNTELSDLVRLYLYWLEKSKVDREYNEKLNAYLTKHPTTPYKDFISEILPKKKALASWGFGFGTGVSALTRQLNNNFTPGPLFSFGMDVNVGRVYTSLYFCGGTFRLKQPYTELLNNDTIQFTPRSKFNYVDGGLKAGYFVVRSKNVHFAPFISIGGTSLKSDLYTTLREDEENLEESEIFNSFAYGAGIHFEVKLKSFVNRRNIYGSEIDNHISFKLESSYQQIPNFKKAGFQGSILNTTLSFVWAFGDF